MVHRTVSRTEAELSAAGLHWSESRHSWLPADSAEAEAEEAVSLGRAASRASNGSTVAGAATPGGTAKDALSRKPSADKLEAEGGQGEVEWLEWDGPDDVGNPYNWPARKKWLTTSIVCAYTVCVSFCGGALPSGNTSMIAELGCSHELAVMALAGFPLGFGLGPLVLAPFSEAYGRSVHHPRRSDPPRSLLLTLPLSTRFYVYCASAVLFTIFLIPIARAENIATVIIFRVFCGIAGSSGSTLVGGSIADMFADKDRGLAMGLFSVASLSGTGLGPLTMGWVEDAWGWRAIEYVQLVFGGVLAVLIVAFTRETRGSVLLSRRAARMRKETGDERYQCRSDAERASLTVMIKTSLTRPLCKLRVLRVPPLKLTARPRLRRPALHRAHRRSPFAVHRIRSGHHLSLPRGGAPSDDERVRLHLRTGGRDLCCDRHRRYHRRRHKPLPGAAVREERGEEGAGSQAVSLHGRWGAVPVGDYDLRVFAREGELGGAVHRAPLRKSLACSRHHPLCDSIVCVWSS